jgi:hypothetical protein
VSARRRLFTALVGTLGLGACGSRTGLGITESVAGGSQGGDGGKADRDADAEHDDDDDETPLEASFDGGVDADARSPGDSMVLCDAGTVVGDVFGQVRYFAGGSTLPAGHYRVTYIDGCMKYSSGQGWTVQAYGPGSPAGSDAWWLVGSTTAAKIIMPPGTVGYLVGEGAYASFDDCVTANLELPPVEFDFEGGKIGLWVEDSPYSDNVPGPGGRSPTWHLGCVM